MSDETITNIAKEFAKHIESVKEAFVLEELKPFYTYNSINGVEWTQKVCLRLAEYQDFKRQFELEKEILRKKLIEDVEKTVKLIEDEEWTNVVEIEKDYILFLVKSLFIKINKRFGMEE